MDGADANGCFTDDGDLEVKALEISSDYIAGLLGPRGSVTVGMMISLYGWSDYYASDRRHSA